MERVELIKAKEKQKTLPFLGIIGSRRFRIMLASMSVAGGLYLANYDQTFAEDAKPRVFKEVVIPPERTFKLVSITPPQETKIASIPSPIASPPAVINPTNQSLITNLNQRQEIKPVLSPTPVVTLTPTWAPTSEPTPKVVSDAKRIIATPTAVPVSATPVATKNTPGLFNTENKKPTQVPTKTPEATPVVTLTPTWTPTTEPTATPTPLKQSEKPTAIIKPGSALVNFEAVNPKKCPYEEGPATYYSRAGCVGCSSDLRMANGEILNDSNLTIAYFGAPINSSVRVTNQDNGQSVIAKVTDTGGFRAHGLLADLNVGTAKAIGFNFNRGRSNIRIEKINC